MDVTAVGPFSNVECPQCGKHTRVKREFGPFTLLRRHAIGGMSVVFVAHDNTLDREVAVKILNENYSADSRRIEAFEHEAKVTAAISHPHVVRVFTTGRAFDRFFIAMEMVPGGHFEDVIKERGTVPEREMLPLAQQVADGLRAAHAAGLIHRDVKPGNILLDAAGNAKIVDFGLALLVDHTGQAKATELWATPYYVPPESIDGQPEDFRSDIYAFGATLYHALAGRPPCNEERMTTHILREAKRKIVPLHTAAPWVTQRTCSLVDRAMAYHPADRFQSYDELLTYLRDAEAQLKAGAKGSVKDQAAAMRRAAVKRQRITLAATGLLAALGVTGLALWLGRTPEPLPQPPPPVAGTNTQANGAGVPDPSAAARIAALYQDARTALGDAEFARARQLFARLRDDPAVGEPTRSWSAVEAALMALLEGAPGEARREAAVSVGYLESATPEERVVRDLVLPVLRGLGHPRAVKPDAALLAGSSPGHLLFWMLAGLKNWENGHGEAALPFFEAAAAADTAGGEAWLDVYPKLAAAHVADIKLLSGPLFTQRPTHAEECRAAIAALDELRPKLQTRGRARFNLLSWKIDLEKLSRSLPAAPPEPPPDTPPPVLDEVLAAVERHAAVCDFPALAAFLRSLGADPPGAKRAALVSLADSAIRFLNDLEEDIRTAADGITATGKLKSGEEFSGVARSAEPRMILVSLGSLRRDCAWADLEPEAVISIYREAVKAEQDAARRIRRHETAIAFQWLTGSRTQALEIAERIAADSPEFRARWEPVKNGLPTP